MHLSICKDLLHRGFTPRAINEYCNDISIDYINNLLQTDTNLVAYQNHDEPIPPFIDGKIILQEPGHKYVVCDKPDFVPTSVTTLIHNFFEPFDGPAIARKLITYIPKYKGRTIESLLSEWKQTGVDGTFAHLELENYILSDRATEVTNKKAISGMRWIDKIYARDLYYWYPEVILYSEEFNVCGTVDLLLVEKETGHVHVLDWKTIRRLNMKSFSGKRGIRPETQHLPDCNNTYYTLQLSIYQYLLEYLFDLVVHTRTLLHITETECISYPTEYWESEAKAMLNCCRDAYMSGHPMSKEH